MTCCRMEFKGYAEGKSSMRPVQMGVRTSLANGTDLGG